MNEIKELVKELRASAEAELEFCNENDTPYLCSAIQKPEDKEKILQYIVELVVKQGISISSALGVIESELNPKYSN